MALDGRVFAAVIFGAGSGYWNDGADSSRLHPLGSSRGVRSRHNPSGRKRGELNYGTVYAMANRNNITVLKGGDKNVC
jgi:hypothetical protein